MSKKYQNIYKRNAEIIGDQQMSEVKKAKCSLRVYLLFRAKGRLIDGIIIILMLFLIHKDYIDLLCYMILMRFMNHSDLI